MACKIDPPPPPDKIDNRMSQRTQLQQERYAPANAFEAQDFNMCGFAA
jgi:hypothetical protein